MSVPFTTFADYPARWQTDTVQRSVASILLLIASIAFGISAGCWWLQRTVFTPDDSPSIAAAILNQSEIRLEIITVVSARTAGALGTTPDTLATFLDSEVLSKRAGAAELAPFIERAHLRAIGSNDDLVVIVPSELVNIVRNEMAFNAPSATIPVPVIGTLKTARTSTGWTMIISAALGLLALIFGLILRPYRSELVQALAELLVATAGSLLIIGWAIPAYVIPAIDASSWTSLAPALAGRSFPVALVSAIILCVGSGALFIAAVNGSRRRQWNGPSMGGRRRSQRW